jgi:hypothetical protein
LYAFEEIMNWARHAYLGGYQFLPIQKSYCTQIDKLEKWMGMENHRPEEKSIEVPGINNMVDTLKVTRFDFLTQFKSLLDDPVLNRDENLAINSTDCFQKYTPPNGLLGECLSGSWYNHAWDEMVKDGICDFMIHSVPKKPGYALSGLFWCPDGKNGSRDNARNKIFPGDIPGYY